jgi:hypothetical protein
MGAILEVLYAVNDLRNSTSNGNHTQLFLFDLQGNTLLKEPFNGSEVISELGINTQPGIYFIKILMDDGSSYVTKLSVVSK